ncbi:MAG: hypothetical protein LBV71_17490 [Prevotella sp.]|jgi:ABC-type multidrug transport system fused ATPase/permease subunit|nr:hypothetical protein [Prevotella sp.]
MEDSKDRIENLKMLYKQACEHHKYYLNWRQISFAGYVVAIYFLLRLFFEMFDSGKIIFSISILLIITAISILFYFIDKRIKELFGACSEVMRKIEEKILDNIDEDAMLFSTLHQKREEHSHTKILEFFYIGVTILSLLLIAIILFWYLYF